MPKTTRAIRSTPTAAARRRASSSALAAHPDGAYVVRTAWLYGAGGPNFAATMLRLAASNPTVLGGRRPARSADLDGRPGRAARRADGCRCPGRHLSRHQRRADLVVRIRQGDLRARPDSTPSVCSEPTARSFVRPARRPSYSVLGHAAWAAAGLRPMRPWREALAAAAASGVLTATDAPSGTARA